MADLVETLNTVKNLLWSGPILGMLLTVGIYLTYRLKGLQLRYLFKALTFVIIPEKTSAASKRRQQGDISAFKSLMTALAGAVGTGNITGIAIAITVGGFGSLFWMWVIAFFGMITAYSEALLAVKYRRTNKLGEACGGPMYTLSSGLGMHKLASAFAFFGIIASFGIGATVQSNSVAAGISETFGMAPLLSGLIMSVVTAMVVLGGIKSIGQAAGILVPFMAIMYVGSGCIVLAFHSEHLLEALTLIFNSAMSGQAALGGFAGASALMAIQQGVSTGIFANEAGLGSLAIAAATAQTEYPARQGLLAISGVFIATMVICTITGLVIAVTQVVGQLDADGSLLTGSALTIAAFQTLRPEFAYVVIFGLIFFAFTTILGWAYYGEKCIEFLWGTRFGHFYRWIYTFSVFVGAIMEPQLVWILANIANGLMAIPNLISIFKLVPVIELETKRYLKILHGGEDALAPGLARSSLAADSVGKP